jgi:hypothetical protein
VRPNKVVLSAIARGAKGPIACAGTSPILPRSFNDLYLFAAPGFSNLISPYRLVQLNQVSCRGEVAVIGMKGTATSR